MTGSLDLGRFIYVDDQYPIGQFGKPVFHQQGHHQKTVGGTDCRALAQHLAANDRMEKGIEPGLGRLIAEDPLAQDSPVQQSLLGQDLWAEVAGDGGQGRGAGCHHFAGNQVGIDHLYPQGRKLVGDGRLAAAYTAGDGYHIHRFVIPLLENDVQIPAGDVIPPQQRYPARDGEIGAKGDGFALMMVAQQYEPYADDGADQ